MVIFFLKTFVAALAIAFCSWLSNKRPDLAGFIISLPLTTMIVLLFSFAEFKDPEKSVLFAKSIFAGIPVSLMFFVPFLLAEKLELSFTTCFVSGVILVAGGFFIHRMILGALS